MLRSLGYLLFTAIFLWGGWGQYKDPAPRAERARKVGLPVTDDFVRNSGLAMMISALGLQLSSTRKLSATILAAQLPGITFAGHRFWELPTGPQRSGQLTHFLKNLSLLGACLVLAGGEDR